MSDLGAIRLELAVVAVGLIGLLVDLWARPDQRRAVAHGMALAVGVIFLASFALDASEPRVAFGGMYALDELALFFKRFFLLAALLVLVISGEFSERFPGGRTEYHALVLFALAGMMFSASANDFALLFVSIELVTVTFYILTSFQRQHVASLEAGVKYLILGALSAAFMVYGIALVFGASGTLNFTELATRPPEVVESRLLATGLLLVFAGLGFKLAAVPFHSWAPDVYQGSPFPTTAFLAMGSKAAGVVLLLRVMFVAAPQVVAQWTGLLLVITVVTILYGVLCAIPQRNLRRLMAYSSIANAGFLLIGVCTGTVEGVAALLFYLGGYLFAVLAVFLVATLAFRDQEEDDIAALAGLGQRSPLLAASLTLGMVSLAGIPPLAGFFGKFLLLKSAITTASTNPQLYWLAVVAIVAVVISMYYYFGVIRAVYWGSEPQDRSPIAVSWPVRGALGLCSFGLLWLGIFPGSVLNLAMLAAQSLL